MSIPISQSIPPPPFPYGNHKFFLYVCDSVSVLFLIWVCFWVCFLFDTNKFICIIFLDSAYKRHHMTFVFLCLISLSMIISNSARYSVITSMGKEFEKE